MSDTRTGRRAKRRPDLDTVYTINDDGSRNMLHPADVGGRWQVLKNLTWMLLLVVYVALPWITINGRPAVHVSLPDRNAYLFGLTFTNQDFYLMFFVLTGIGFGLFVVTALFGRVFCGFVCPQTVFMEGIFRRVERWIEGPRVTRIRRNLGPATAGKVWRKALKHVMFLGMSYLIAHVFLSYFIPVRELVRVVFQSPADHASAFGWTMFWTAVLYFDYSWFREQTCVVICPYGRLQSTLIDEDTIVIGYDEKRGEPRSKGVEEGGDCIDCYRCVEVCPTGIDIRNGLQLECIGCANCIDACDDIMRRIDKPAGLVRYDSQRSFRGEKRKSLLRPRTFVYVVMGLVGLTVAALTVGGRTSFEARSLRPAGRPFNFTETQIENLHTVNIQNKSDRETVYVIDLSESPQEMDVIAAQSSVSLPSLGDVDVPIFFYLDKKAYREPFGFTVTVTDSLSGESKDLKLTFRGPRL